MPTPKRMVIPPSSKGVACLLLLAVLLTAPMSMAFAQESDSPERVEAFKLFDQNKFTDTIPLLEKVIKANPSDMQALERLGWVLFVVSGSTTNPQERKKLLDRARGFLNRSKDLGNDSELLRTALENVGKDDPFASNFSSVKEADAAMREGESAHVKGDLDKAIVGYERALVGSQAVPRSPLRG